MKKPFLRLLRKTGVLRRIALELRITVNGKRFVIPVRNEIGFDLFLDPGDEWMSQILKELLGGSGYERTFLDVGVNTGQTLLRVKSIDAEIDYVGIEPNPVCVNYLNTLIEANAFDRTEIIPVAIGAQTTVATLNLYSDLKTDAGASLIDNFRDPAGIRRKMRVPVLKVSDIGIAADRRIGIVKIDVEGAELEVITGMIERIRSDRPLVLVEILPAYSPENLERISRQQQIAGLMLESGYTLWRIIKAGGHLASLEQLSAFRVDEDTTHVDYIFVPEEQVEEVRFARLAKKRG